MADELDAATETLVLTPETWSSYMTDFMYAEPVVMNRCHRVEQENAVYGSKVNLPQMPTMTVADVTATTGAVANQAITFTETELSIDQWRHNSVTLVDKAAIQAKRDILADFRRAFPQSLSADIDGKLLGLHGSISTYTQGDSSSIPNEDLLTAAVGDLLGANHASTMRNPDNVTFVFHPVCWKYLKKVAGWNDASATGQALGGRLSLSLPSLYGIPVMLSSKVASSTGYRNLLMLKDALALAIQKGITIQEIPVDALAKKITASCLFGVAAYNEARAVKITTATA